jgi:hypothetical protein
MFGKPEPKPKFYIRPWGHHTDGWVVLRYTSGSHAEKIFMKGDETRKGGVVFLPHGIEWYAMENGYMLADFSDKLK